MNIRTRPEKPTSRWARRFAVGVPILVVVSVLVGWYVLRTVRSKLIAQLTRETGLPAHVERVGVSLHGINAGNVTLGDLTDPILSIAELSVRAPFRELLSTDPKLDLIRVDFPVLKLSANDSGELAWPFSSEGEMSLPSDRIVVVDARLEIDQPRRQRVTARASRAVLQRHTDGGFDFDVHVEELLGSSWQFAGDANSDGVLNARLSSESVHLDTRQLGQLALVSRANRSVPVVVDGGIDVKIQRDVTAEKVTAEVSTTSLRFPSLSCNFAAIKSNAELRDNTLRIHNVGVSLGTGLVTGDVLVTFGEGQIKGQFDSEVDRVPADEVREMLFIPEELDGYATGKIWGEFESLHSGVLLSLKGEGRIDEGSAFAINSAPARIAVNVDEFVWSPNKASTIRGAVELREMRATDVPVEELASVVGVELNEHDRGKVNLAGNFRLPLESASDPRTWSVTGTLSARELVTHGVVISDCRSNVAVQGGRIRFDSASAQFSGNTLKGSASWPLVGEADGWMKVFGDIPLERLVESPTNDQTTTRPTGLLSFRANLEVPSRQAVDLRSWRGVVAIEGEDLQWGEIDVSNFQLDGKLRDGTAVIENAIAELQTQSSLQAKGLVRIEEELPAEFHFAAKDLSPLVVEPLFHLSGSSWRLGSFSSGALNIEGDVSTALRSANQLQAWRANVSARGTRLTFGNKEIVVDGGMRLSDSKLEFDQVRLSMSDSGHLAIDGTLPLSESVGESDLELRWQTLQIAPWRRLFGSRFHVAGTSSGRFHFVCNGLNRLGNARGEGIIEVRDAAIAGIPLGVLKSSVAARDGVLHLDHVQLSERTNVGIAGSMELSPPMRFDAELNVVDEPIGYTFEALGKEMPLRGVLSFQGRATGVLLEKTFGVKGDVQMHKPYVGDTKLSQMDFRFEATSVQGLHATGKLLGGTVSIGVDPLFPEIPEREVIIQANGRNLDIEEITRLVEFGALGLRLEGALDLDATVSAGKTLEVQSADVRLQNGHGTYQGIPIKRLAANASVREGAATLRLSGTLMEGELSIDGSAPIGDLTPIMFPLQVKLTGAKFDSAVVPRLRQLRAVTGTANIDGEMTLALPSLKATGNGQLELRTVAWNRKTISPIARSKFVLNNETLRLEEVDANVASGGSVRGSLNLPLRDKNVGEYDIVVSRVPVDSLLSSYVSSFRAPRVAGSVEARLVGRIGRQVQGRGDVRVSRLATSMVNASSIRIPISYVLDTERWGGKLSVRRTTTRVASGTVTSQGVVEFGRRLNLSLETDITKVDFRAVSKAALGQATNGRVSGKLKLIGNGIRSVRDLSGSFHGTLEDSQALRLPVLSDLVSFASGANLSSSRSFDSGKIILRLNKGAISTPGIALKNNRAEVFLKGRVFLDQRLDLDVAVQTGNISPDFGLQQLAQSPLSELALPGSSVVTNSLEFLSNRVIYAHIGGTMRSPHFKLRADQLMRDALLRYYLSPELYRQTLRDR